MQSSTDIDVIIVGAGISGINAAYRVQTETKLGYEILEARHDLGGTWSMFQYPGLRSDSDMYTLGFPFRPWSSPQQIAEGKDIYDYVKDTAQEFGIDARIQFNSEVRSANWSSLERRWTLTVVDNKTQETRTRTAKFVLFASGYYDYQSGYQPHIAGMDGYKGQWIHPQAWPKDYDYTDKKMIIIGSGATAVTLLPNLAKKARHVTLLQRSPSYFVALPNGKNRSLLSYLFPTRLYHWLLRVALAIRSYAFYWVCHWFPNVARYVLRALVKRQLPKSISIDPHFDPSYKPWDQRVCIVPDGDMFKALREGKADIATGRVDTITPNGLRLTDGTEYEADAIVCATGLNMKFFGGADIIVDGEKVDINKRFIFRGQMISGVPNCSLAFGYVSASWTLGSDVCSIVVCRLLNGMQKRNISHVTPRAAPIPLEKSQKLAPLTSGYFDRAEARLPRSAGKLNGSTWSMRDNWFVDVVKARYGDVFSEMDLSYGEAKKGK